MMGPVRGVFVESAHLAVEIPIQHLARWDHEGPSAPRERQRHPDDCGSRLGPERVALAEPPTYDARVDASDQALEPLCEERWTRGRRARPIAQDGPFEPGERDDVELRLDPVRACEEKRLLREPRGVRDIKDALRRGEIAGRVEERDRLARPRLAPDEPRGDA